MQNFIEYLAIIIVLTVFFQLYFFAVSGTGVEKQEQCQKFGIVFTTIGIFCLIYRQLHIATGGLILIMLGFRLISHGLDRLNKKIIITQYEDEP